jgi:hypothetical protein
MDRQTRSDHYQSVSCTLRKVCILTNWFVTCLLLHYDFFRIKVLFPVTVEGKHLLQPNKIPSQVKAK